jgi:hypothetical protein
MKSLIRVKVIVDDLDALKSIKPEQAIAYLQSKGWQKEHEIQRNIASVWGYQKPDGEQLQIVIPHNMDITGYPFSMSFMLETLANIYDASQLDILESILEFSENQTEVSDRRRVLT